MSQGYWTRPSTAPAQGFLTTETGFSVGDTAEPCGCCGPGPCKCFPPTGTVRWVTYTTSPAGPFTELTEKTAAASFEFVSEWIDCSYSESYDTSASPYVTLPWHALPQKLEMRMTITGTATAAVAPVSPGYNVISLTAVLEYRCRYVSYTDGTHTVEADYYAGSRYPSTDSINAPGGINAAESVVFSAQNDYSDEGIITLSDANISVPVRVKYRRSNSSYYLAWDAKTTGIYSVSAGSDIVALTTSPNSGSVSLSISVHVNDGGSGYTLSASQSYRRITSGIIAVLEDVTTTRTRSYTINSNANGGWLKTIYVGNAETANADQVANRILSDWVNTWTLYPPSGGSKTLAVARYNTSYQYLTTRYFTIHSLNPALHGDMLNFQLVADPYVPRFIVSGSTAARPGQFTADAYEATDSEKSVTMVYPGGEDVTDGYPNPLLVKITSVAVDTLPNVAINDTVTAIKVGGSWVAPGGDYLATHTGYPAAINYESGASSSDDASILFQVKNAGGAVIGTGTLASHFAGIDAGDVPSVINFDYCPYTVGTVSLRCGYKTPRALFYRGISVTYFLQRKITGGSWSGGSGGSGTTLTVLDASTGATATTRTQTGGTPGTLGYYTITVTSTHSGDDTRDATYDCSTSFIIGSSSGLVTKTYSAAFDENIDNGVATVVESGSDSYLGYNEYRIIRKAEMTAGTFEGFRISRESSYSYNTAPSQESYGGLDSSLGLTNQLEVSGSFVHGDELSDSTMKDRSYLIFFFSGNGGEFTINESYRYTISPCTGHPTYSCFPGKRTWDDVLSVDGFTVDGDSNYVNGIRPGTWYFSAYVP